MRKSKIPLSKTEIATLDDHKLFVQYREWREWKEQVKKWKDERIQLYKDRKDPRPNIREHWERQLRWAQLTLRRIDADMKRRGAIPFSLRLPGASKQMSEKEARAITVRQLREALRLHADDCELIFGSGNLSLCRAKSRRDKLVQIEFD